MSTSIALRAQSYHACALCYNNSTQIPQLQSSLKQTFIYHSQNTVHAHSPRMRVTHAHAPHRHVHLIVPSIPSINSFNSFTILKPYIRLPVIRKHRACVSPHQRGVCIHTYSETTLTSPLQRGHHFSRPVWPANQERYSAQAGSHSSRLHNGIAIAQCRHCIEPRFNCQFSAIKQTRI